MVNSGLAESDPVERWRLTGLVEATAERYPPDKFEKTAERNRFV